MQIFKAKSIYSYNIFFFFFPYFDFLNLYNRYLKFNILKMESYN